MHTVNIFDGGFETIYKDHKHVEKVVVKYGKSVPGIVDLPVAEVTVYYHEGAVIPLHMGSIDISNACYGITVSPDGMLMYVQNYDMGIYCYEIPMRNIRWMQGIKGIGTLIASDEGVCCLLPEEKVLLLRAEDGSEVMERAAIADDMFEINENHFLIQVSSSFWNIIRKDNLYLIQMASSGKICPEGNVKEARVVDGKLHVKYTVGEPTIENDEIVMPEVLERIADIELDSKVFE